MNKLSKILTTGTLLGAVISPNLYASQESDAIACFEPYQAKIEQLLPENQFTEEQESMLLYGFDRLHKIKLPENYDFREDSVKQGTNKLSHQVLKQINNTIDAYKVFNKGKTECLDKIQHRYVVNIIKDSKKTLEDNFKNASGGKMFLNSSRSRDYYQTEEKINGVWEFTTKPGLPNKGESKELDKKLYPLEIEIFPNLEHHYHEKYRIQK